MKARLDQLCPQCEYEAGPITANCRVLLEPKSLLKFLMVIISIVAFVLTMIFTEKVNGNSLSCNTVGSTSNLTRSMQVHFKFPFNSDEFSASYDNLDNSQRNLICSREFNKMCFVSFAEFFVAMGIASSVYCLVILVVYTLSDRPDLSITKWLVLMDLTFTALFAILVFLADIMWSAGISLLRDYIDDELNQRGRGCLHCIANTARDPGSFLYLIISVVFGWLLYILWVSSLWFVFKDSVWHRELANPFSPAYSLKTAPVSERAMNIRSLRTHDPEEESTRVPSPITRPTGTFHPISPSPPPVPPYLPGEEGKDSDDLF